MQQTMRDLREKHCKNRVFVRQNMQTKLMTKAQQKRVTNLRGAEATALHKPGVYHANLTGAKGRLACSQTFYSFLSFRKDRRTRARSARKKINK